jgi:hypothetical protein
MPPFASCDVLTFKAPVTDHVALGNVAVLARPAVEVLPQARAMASSRVMISTMAHRLNSRALASDAAAS